MSPRHLIAALAAGLVICIAAPLGLTLAFSDLGPGESPGTRWALAVGVFLVSGALFGWLVPRVWYLASLAAIGPFLLAMLALTHKVQHGGPTPYWSYIALGLLGLPGVALIGGRIGKRFRGQG